jgi:hypothetical protein
MIGGSISSSGQISGSFFNFPTFSEGIWIERVTAQFGFSTIQGAGTVGGGSFCISHNAFGGYGPVINIATIGDSTIDGNQIDPVSVPGATSATGISLSGDPGGARIVNNKFNAGGFGYSFGLFIAPSISNGDLTLIANSIEEFNSIGVIIQAQNSSVVFGNLQIIGGNIASSFANTEGIQISGNTPGWFSNTSILGVAISVEGTCIDIGSSATQFNITGNILSSAGTGISVVSGSTGGMIGPNNFSGVTNQIVDGSGLLTYAAITTTKPTYP